MKKTGWLKKRGWLENDFLGTLEDQAKGIYDWKKNLDKPEANNPAEDRFKVAHKERVAWDLVQEIERLREIVSRNKIPQDAIYSTVLVMILSYDLGLSHPIYAIRGWKKGGPNKEPAFNLLVEYARQNSKRPTALSMWKYLIKKLEEAELTGQKVIEGYDFVYEKKENQITLYFNNKKKRPRDMGFRSFQRCVKDFKEELKKNSQ